MSYLNREIRSRAVSLDMKEMRKLFGHELRRHHNLNDSAIRVLSSSLTQGEARCERVEMDWKEYYRVRLQFIAPNREIIGETIQTLACDENYKQDRPPFEEMVAMVSHRCCSSAAHDGDLIAKLCLVWSGEILEDEQGIQPQAADGFSPEVWSSKIINDFENTMVMRGWTPDVK